MTKIVLEEIKNIDDLLLFSKAFKEELIKNKFDYIFFTGSSKVGEIIMKKASENLMHCHEKVGHIPPPFLRIM